MLPGQGSRTARAIAVGRAVGSGDLRDPLVERLLPRRDRLLVAALRRLRPWNVPTLGATAHAALRMDAIDTALREAVAALDPPVVVVLGAGYDTRAWRLGALVGRRVVEVDHPDTQAAKRAGVADLRPRADDVALVGADLRVDDLAAVLSRAGQDPTAPVVWVWEAVVPYLPVRAVDDTLAVLAERSPPGSVLLVTTMTPTLLAPPSPGLSASAFLGFRVLGEPLRTTWTEAQARDRLAAHGWASAGSRGPRDWAASRGVALVGPVLDERLHVATRTAG